MNIGIILWGTKSLMKCKAVFVKALKIYILNSCIYKSISRRLTHRYQPLRTCHILVVSVLRDQILAETLDLNCILLFHWNVCTYMRVQWGSLDRNIGDRLLKSSPLIQLSDTGIERLSIRGLTEVHTHAHTYCWSCRTSRQADKRGWK
jgi:hypothetical protein